MIALNRIVFRPALSAYWRHVLPATDISAGVRGSNGCSPGDGTAARTVGLEMRFRMLFIMLGLFTIVWL